MRADDFKYILTQLFGNQPAQWHDGLQGAERWRVIVNALTRLRFCTNAGEMEFSIKGGQADAPPGYSRWFEVPGRATLDQPIAFGHWSTLNAGQTLHRNTLALDTGCVWGGCLTAARLGPRAGEFELMQVPCEQQQRPG